VKIFIAGCARSGTDLLKHLMKCFSGVLVWPSEHTALELEGIRDSTHTVVMKRTAQDYLTLHKLSADIELLYCVRHPFDCLTSSHPGSVGTRRFHVTENRWRGEYEAFRILRLKQPQRRICIVKYEDLVSCPNETQVIIAKQFMLEKEYQFTDNPDGRRISTSSIRKWTRDSQLLSYLYAFDPSFQGKMRQFCEEFGYEVSNKADPSLCQFK